MSASRLGGALDYSAPKVMGILNVTPDSFSDGGRYTDVETAVAHAFEMVDQGADIIDIGAESTRPGYTPVSAEVEMERLIPVVRRLSESLSVPISVDTMKAAVAAKAVEAGADIVNDVNGLRDEGMLALIASTGVPAVLMHMNGSSADVHSNSMHEGFLAEIRSFLDSRLSDARDAGVKDSQIILDPGVGFGKTMEQNIEIIRGSGSFQKGFPVLIGASRKRVLATMYPGMDVDEATVLASMEAIRCGADIVRVHDVQKMVAAIRS